MIIIVIVRIVMFMFVSNIPSRIGLVVIVVVIVVIRS
jgi:hypothetical protein